MPRSLRQYSCPRRICNYLLGRLPHRPECLDVRVKERVAVILYPMLLCQLSHSELHGPEVVPRELREEVVQCLAMWRRENDAQRQFRRCHPVRCLGRPFPRMYAPCCFNVGITIDFVCRAKPQKHQQDLRGSRNTYQSSSGICPCLGPTVRTAPCSTG